MYSWWKPSTVVTMTASGLVSAIILSKSVGEIELGRLAPVLARELGRDMQAAHVDVGRGDQLEMVGVGLLDRGLVEV